MKSVKFVIAALGLVAGDVVLAENLVVYAETSSGTVHYYDTESIKKNTNIATVWTYWDQSKNKSVKERYSRVKYRLDCYNEKLAVISFADYDARGGVVYSNTDETGYNMRSVIPESVGAGLFNAVCN